MEINYLSSSPLTLKIGGFAISCTRHGSDIRFEIPFAGMAFYQPKEQGTDFIFDVNHVEPDDSGELLFGSADFSVPTFLYRRANGAYDWLVKTHEGTPELSFRISSDWTSFTLYEDNTDTAGARAFKELGALLCYAFLKRDACVLHGVVMEHEGRGILVTAPAGTGKTTHTRMWRDLKNALILNGDRCLCRKEGGVWYAYGMPWSGSSGEYINRRVPVTHIVSLARGGENAVRPLSAFEGTIVLMQRIFAPVWRGELQDRAFSMCEELGASVPMLELACRPDPESVEVLCAAIG